MTTLDCGHDGPPAGQVCCHFVEGEPEAYLRHFSGRGLEFHLICPACRRDPQPDPADLRTACGRCFERIRDEGSWQGISGLPEVKERAIGLSFQHESVRLAEPLPGAILDVQPVAGMDRNLWVVLTQTGELLRLDLDEGSAEPLCRLPESRLNLHQAVALRLAADGRLAAAVNRRGQHGVVLDLATGRPTFQLDRGDYHNQHCDFSLAFIDVGGRTLLIHATAWNRLDVSDPLTGALLTARSPTSYRTGEQRPEHYLDYFHCGLAVSPGGKHVAEDGWVWSPLGAVIAWDIRPWLEGNVWESEDGPSRRALCHRDYHWHGPLCWLGEDRLAVWGYGQDDEWLLPAVRIFDVPSREEVRWFPGTKGDLVFDGYLFSFGGDGTSVWDADSGERLLEDAALHPLRYHHGARSFFTPAEGGSFQVSRLRGRPVDPGWLSANGGTVARVAWGIAAERDFAALPVLADALEEAGCQDPEILGHCRRPGPHATRCWVVDQLLGR
jgi:hypothetical protein